MNVLRASIDRQTIMPTGTRTVPEPELVRGVKAQYISQLRLVAVLVFASLVIIKGISKGEFSYNTDETQHAVTGMYVADLVRDRPFSNPIEYTYQYYAHYPALSGVLHWPPLFYVFEGISFLIFGTNVMAARLTILMFALLALFFWYRTVERLQRGWTAALSTILLAFVPSVLLFEKTVMLEIPCLSFCIAATYFWLQYLEEGRAAPLYWFTGFASAALLTKQNSIYLIPFCILSVVALRKWQLVWSHHTAVALVIGMAMVGPFYTLVYLIHWKPIAMDLAEQYISGFAKLIFYFETLPAQTGWMLLILSVLGLLTSRRWDKHSTTLVMLSWIAACYLTFTLIGHKEARYALYWLPPFTYFTAGLLTKMFYRPWMRIAATSCAIVLVGQETVAALSFERPYVTGYAQAAKRVTQASPSAVILYDADLPGNFIFFIRANDPNHRFMVLRKALYAYRIKQRGGSVELVHNREEIQALLRQDGIRFIAVSDNIPLRFNSQTELRQMLLTPQFRLFDSFHLSDSQDGAHSGNLRIYENLAWAPPTEKYLHIKMLTLDRDIVVPLEGFEWKTGAVASQHR
jgi:Dolichyl-phosphate-mannose-protein mannosyltransferase